jgi:hypothetical protein
MSTATDFTIKIGGFADMSPEENEGRSILCLLAGLIRRSVEINGASMRLPAENPRHPARPCISCPIRPFAGTGYTLGSALCPPYRSESGWNGRSRTSLPRIRDGTDVVRKHLESSARPVTIGGGKKIWIWICRYVREPA